MRVAPSNARRQQSRQMFRPAGMSESDEEYDEMGREVTRSYRRNVNPPAQPEMNPQEKIFKECTDGNVEGVKTAFAEGVSIELVYSNGFNILMHACHLGHADIAQFLLEQGANPNFRNTNLYTPLMVLCFSFCDDADKVQKCAKILISGDANVNVADSHGTTPLMYACKNMHVGAAQELINAGANLDEKDSQGWTALFWAVYKCNLPLVKMLIGAGARKKKKDHRGRIAYSLAVGRESTKEIADLIRPKHYADEDDSGIVADCDEYVDEADARTEIAELLENLAKINNTDLQVANRNLVKGQQIDLFTFLTITDEELQALGIRHCWQRRQTLEFVKKYHLQSWTKVGPLDPVIGSTLINKELIRFKSLTYSNIMSIVLDLENRMTVIEASAVALLRQWQTEATERPGDYGNLPQLIKVCETESKFNILEFETLINAIEKMEKRIVTPCDMVMERKRSKYPSLTTVIVSSSLCVLIILGVKKLY